MSFIAKISDPLVGSSYTTLLTTLVSILPWSVAEQMIDRQFSPKANIGGQWVRTFFVWLIDLISWKSCIIDQTKTSFNSTYSFVDNKCLNNQEKTACVDNGGRCYVDVDGYYIEAAINVVYGIIWYQLGKETIKYLQEVPLNDWRVLTGQPKTEKAIKPEMWREVKEKY
jgi:hypothetical protein